jgi:hypothetical protein
MVVFILVQIHWAGGWLDGPAGEALIHGCDQRPELMSNANLDHRSFVCDFQIASNVGFLFVRVAFVKLHQIRTIP